MDKVFENYCYEMIANEFIKFLREIKVNPINWTYISENPNLSWNAIKNNMDLEWDWLHITKHKCINMKIINEYERDVPWRRITITENPNITYDDIKKNPSLYWSWGILYSNSNINIDILIERKIKDVNSHRYISSNLSRNTNLTIDIIKRPTPFLMYIF